MAGTLKDKGNLTSAEACFRRALAIKEKCLGPDHRSTAIVLK